MKTRRDDRQGVLQPSAGRLLRRPLLLLASAAGLVAVIAFSLLAGLPTASAQVNLEQSDCDEDQIVGWDRCCVSAGGGDPSCSWCQTCQDCGVQCGGGTGPCRSCGPGLPGIPGGPGSPGSPGSTADPNNGPGGDGDGDGEMDCWRGSVQTSDPNATTLDGNDTLGTNYGGTNSTRPGHDGIDIQCDAGDNVFSVADGTVAYIESNPSANNCGIYIRVTQTGTNHQSIYCHLQGVASGLSVGASVGVGTQIGTCNSTGNSTGDHLHLKRRNDSTIVDPEAEMNGC